jgi:hypothetical protein
MHVGRDSLEMPALLTKPHHIFVATTFDLFECRDVDVSAVFAKMNQYSEHSFQIATARADRLDELNGRVQWTPNIAMGVRIDEAVHVGRINSLRRCGAVTRFVHMRPFEKLPVGLDAVGAHFVLIEAPARPDNIDAFLAALEGGPARVYFGIRPRDATRVDREANAGGADLRTLLAKAAPPQARGTHAAPALPAARPSALPPVHRALAHKERK